MTLRAARPDRPELRPIVTGSMALWLPPFVMCVVGDKPTFEALAPAVGPSGHISPGAHLWRTVSPFEDGYCEPGDGSYAEPLRRAHERAGITPVQLGLAVQWNISIMCELARRTGYAGLIPQLTQAALDIAEDFAADSKVVIPSLAALDAHFRDVTLAEGMRDAFWAIMDFPRVQDVVGQPGDDAILTVCAEFLPESFVNQFYRQPLS